MFHLSYDAKHKVLLSSFSGAYGPEDIALRDSAVRRFVAQRGLCHGIMDFSAVDSIAVPLDLLIRRSHQPPILRGHQRVIVAPTEPALAFNRLVAAHQLYARKEEPPLVGSMREAYRLIGVSRPNFVPIPLDAAARRERQLDRALREIGQAIADDKWIAFAESIDRAIGRSALRPKHITLTDLLNVAIGRSGLREGDVRTSCPSCHKAFVITNCPVSHGRATTYLCPTCRAWTVRITFVDARGTVLPEGYVLGAFEVTTRADLHIAGVRLPRTSSG